MSWFASRIILFVVPVLLLLAALETSLRRLPNHCAFTNHYLLHSGREVEILVLGGSHAFNGVDPEGLGDQAFNAANVAQDHRLDRAVLERYIDSLPRLRCIILPVSYCSIGSRMELSGEPWRIKNYAIHMGLREPGMGLDMRFELMTGKISAAVGRLVDHWNDDGSDIVFRPHGGSPGRPQPGIDMDEHGLATAKRHTKWPSGPFEANVLELERIIELAEGRGISVLLFSPPAYESYRRHLNGKQLALSRLTPQRLARENAHVHYLDLMADPQFTVEDFGNSDHLQGSGNRKLTAILARAIASSPEPRSH